MVEPCRTIGTTGGVGNCIDSFTTVEIRL